jgi:zinc/manganese transport system permease protein
VIAVVTASFSPNLAHDLGDMLAQEFMRNAFLAGGSIAISAGLVGYFVVLRNQVFTSDALGHVAFTGGLGGLLAGIPLMLAVFASTVAGALAIGWLGGRSKGRDVVIGTVFAWVLGLGVLCLSIYTSSRSAASGVVGVTVLFGSVLALQAPQATIAAVAGIGTALALLVVCRPLLFATIDPEVAAARAVPVRLVTTVFLVLLGLTVAEAVQAVGALLIFGLLVTPAAVAQNLTSRPYAGMALSAALGLTFVWVGLALAFYLPYPASFLIIAISFAAYLGSAAVRGARR